MNAPCTVHALRADHLDPAFGIGNPTPALSWTTATDVPGWRQAAYQLELRRGDERLLADEVASGDSTFVDWPFPPLRSRERVQVRVRVRGQDGSASDWSAPLEIEAGLLETGDWSAAFITPDWEQDTAISQPSPLLRREFDVHAGLVRARLYATACGCYEAFLNGERVGDQVLAPGWTSYRHRLRVQAHDVTALLREGRNALGAVLGDGWFAGRLGFGQGMRNQWGERLALLAQLELVYADGHIERVVSDAHWRAATGGLRSSEIYDGECYDARLEPDGWQQPGFDDAAWSGVRHCDYPLQTLVAPEGPPMRRIQTLAAQQVLTTPSGKIVLDFGQNLVGWLRIRVRGPRGRRITLRHAEVLQDGELCTEPLRTAKATDVYLCKGQGEETWEPRFTFHGFRYAQIDGWPGDLQPGDVEAVVVHTDMRRSGWFECSEPLVTRLHENVVWSMRGNFLDVPTDCPQRDERMGWTGDLQVFCPTATYLYDCFGMLGSWLQDVAAEQAEKGVVPFVVPDCMGGLTSPPTAAWGDVATMAPWVLYQRSGDRHALARQYPSMRAWVEQVAGIAGESCLWNKGYQFGDWLDPYAPADNPAAGKTHPYLLATAHFARSAQVLAEAAGVLGKDQDAAHYAALAERIGAAFRRQYVTPDGLMLGDSITAYSMALVFGLLEGEQREGAARRLRELVQDSGYHIATGFVGTPLVCDALVLAGAEAMAYKLLLQRECPSWLYPVTQGATTIWERWDSLMPDGRVNPSGMTSFNHYAFGAVADWLHRHVGGLSALAPGFARLRIAPRPGGGLTHASTRHLTPHGEAAVAWRIEGEVMQVEAVVPPNTTAVVALPGAEEHEVGSGSHRWQVPFASDSGTPRRRLSVHDSAAELMEDAEVWATVKAAMIRAMPALAEHLDNPGTSGQQSRSVPLAEQLALIPASFRVTETVVEALDALYAARERGDAGAAADTAAAVEQVPEPAPPPTGTQATLAALTLEEKAALVCGQTVWTTHPVERLGIPSLRLSDGPHGLRRQPQGGDHLGLYDSDPATCFPTAAGLASSWDVELLEQVGTALGREARAAGVHVLLGPGLNIKRSPLCGRNFEYFSEDPLLSGRLGAAWVHGVQGQGVGASLKHYAVNNQETDRMRVDAQVDERTLREIYLPAFEYIVRQQAPWTVMGAYNKVNGEHACANTWLLDTVLRREWGFDGLVVSDWGAVTDQAACLRAGTDLDMPARGAEGPAAVVAAVRSGALDEASLDRAVGKLLHLAERVAAASAQPAAAPDPDAHHALARRAATESAVLLKNDGPLLPLDPAGNARIAVIGEFARSPRYQGEGSSRVNPTRLETALDALRAVAGDRIGFAAGFPLEGADEDGALREEALALAARSDVVLLFLGLPDKEESEGFDRTHLQLPQVQRELLAALAAVQPRLAVLLSNGAVVQTADWEGQAQAILELWLGGQAGGSAAADLVFGRANPAGRLAETIPLRLEDTPAFLNFPGHGGVVRYGEGLYVGYRGYDTRKQAVAYPFGHGLSYTRFDYADLRVQVHGSGQQAGLTVRLALTNSGERDGSEVVQVYLRDRQATLDRPAQELKGFAKVALAAGQTSEVVIELGPRELSYYHPQLQRWVIEGGEFEVAVGASSRDIRLQATVTVDAELPAAAISGEHSILEWLQHPKGGPVLRALMAQAPQQPGVDPEAMLRMIEGMPMNRLVAMSQGALTQEMVDQMVAAANA
ncbi:family 78 glycoside hydrolase catalytic domain [[Pseudomonas] boreopolis]|uniref:family 78 glycoside hydrolase catalytic domain n=1 Tax=Xanthomonas boreopolis TaxID=86183 RepID=UPI003DA00970